MVNLCSKIPSLWFDGPHPTYAEQNIRVFLKLVLPSDMDRKREFWQWQRYQDYPWLLSTDWGERHSIVIIYLRLRCTTLTT